MTAWFKVDKSTIPTPEDALPGRGDALWTPGLHHVLGTPMTAPFAPPLEQAVFAMGCFWGAERVFWQAEGVFTTAVGYCAGLTPNPTYQEVCTGATGHTEAVLVVFDPGKIPYSRLLQLFWENHDPTQGMRQGNDAGTQYRSGIYPTSESQTAAALESKAAYQEHLAAEGFGAITTEIEAAPEFYYAEEAHQQYLAKNPGGYCGLGGTGVSCPIGLATAGE